MKLRRFRPRFGATLLVAGLFLSVMTGTASAAGLLDMLGIYQVGSAPPAGSAPAPAPAGATAPDPGPPPASAAAPATAGIPGAPAVPPNSGSGRRVVYSVGAQRVWLVNEGESLHGTWLVSGRAGEPNPGNYSVFSRSRHARAKAAGVRMEFMVRFARTPGLPIGFHSIPVNRHGRQIQTIEELGTYQSLGCVRQRYEDAVVMWEFAQIGTPVIVVP
ncbi:MAG TPA: L,D-transpeptidase [Actinomycetota bacterium]|nr:L,D-transpeptidase [Actinomycetota bacterium]